MKKVVIIFIILCGNYAFAQDARQIAQDSSRLKNTNVNYINITPPVQTGRSYNFPCSSIVFNDVRFDTSSIGVSNRLSILSDKNKFKYVQFQFGLAGFMNNYFNNLQNLQDRTHTNKLVCYIKKFRIIEMDSTYEVNAKKERELQLRAVIEAYYVQGTNIYPAFRMDTSFSELLAENKQEYPIINTLLQAFADKISRIDTIKILRRNAYTGNAVEARYAQRFALPLLTAASFSKGVYASKDEFYKNAPSIAEYEWRPDKKVNLLYTKDNNRQWNITRKNIFGFCDGKQIWIRVENSFYPAFRRENTFEMIAPLLLKRIVNNKPTTYSMPMGARTYYISVPSQYNSKYYNDKSIYQIDMETGEFY